MLFRLNQFVPAHRDYQITISEIESRPALTCVGDGFYVFVPCDMLFEERHKPEWDGAVSRMMERVADAILNDCAIDAESDPGLVHGWEFIIENEFDALVSAIDAHRRTL